MKANEQLVKHPLRVQLAILPQSETTLQNYNSGNNWKWKINNNQSIHMSWYMLVFNNLTRKGFFWCDIVDHQCLHSFHNGGKYNMLCLK